MHRLGPDLAVPELAEAAGLAGWCGVGIAAGLLLAGRARCAAEDVLAEGGEDPHAGAGGHGRVREASPGSARGLTRFGRSLKSPRVCIVAQRSGEVGEVGERIDLQVAISVGMKLEVQRSAEVPDHCERRAACQDLAIHRSLLSLQLQLKVVHIIVYSAKPLQHTGSESWCPSEASAVHQLVIHHVDRQICLHKGIEGGAVSLLPNLGAEQGHAVGVECAMISAHEQDI